tara:strand:- start:1767 stop:1937 length:171 start_codon:yes stop_codon:yes gene_type:complete
MMMVVMVVIMMVVMMSHNRTIAPAGNKEKSVNTDLPYLAIARQAYRKELNKAAKAC